MFMEDICSEVDIFLFVGQYEMVVFMNNYIFVMYLNFCFVKIGYDIIVSVILWILYLLVEYFEYQMKCQEEIDRVVSEIEFGEFEWYD